MDRLRSFYDADRSEAFIRPTKHVTDLNKHEMFCGICGGNVFVDKELFGQLNRAIEEGIDNPLLCEGCEDSYEEAAHPH